MNYIGIDIGSHAFKAATILSGSSAPQVLRCMASDSFFAPAVRLGPEGDPIEAGSSAYFERHRDHRVVTGFRDVAGNADSELTGASNAANMLQLFTYCLNAFGQCIAEHSPNAICAAIPDYWRSTSYWPYALAQSHANWKPLFLVREWQAAAAIQGRVDGDSVVFVSLGAGSTSITLVERRNELWRQLASVFVRSVSGRLLKQRLIDQLDEEMVQAIRRKPTEDAQADYQLREAVDRLFWSLVHHGTGTVDLDLFGRKIARTMEPTEMSSLAEPDRDDVVKRVRDLLAKHKLRFADIVVWGELAQILPVRSWFKEFTRPEVAPYLLPMDAIAAGAARLCLAAAEIELVSDTQRLSGVCNQGRYRERFADFSANDEVFAILELLPTDLLQSGEMALGTLRWVNHNRDAKDPSKVVHRQITLGRNPAMGWVFESEQFPEVSFEHCVVFRRGEEYLIKDLDSTNGTFVNGQRITVQKLKSNDQIRLGLHGPEFRFSVSGR